MQRHRRLACARPTLHDEHAGQRRADDLVLLRLDRGDDVAHPVGARRVEGGEQCAVAGECVGWRGPVEGVDVEHVVVDRGDVAAGGRDVPAADDPHGFSWRGPVERLRGRRPPVEHQLVLLVVGQSEATDVPGAVGAQVQSAEHQPVLDRVEGAQPLLVQRGERVPLALSRRGPTDAHPAHAGQLLRVPCTLRVQRRIRRVDARLVRERLAAAHGSLRGYRFGARNEEP